MYDNTYGKVVGYTLRHVNGKRTFRTGSGNDTHGNGKTENKTE